MCSNPLCNQPNTMADKITTINTLYDLPQRIILKLSGSNLKIISSIIAIISKRRGKLEEFISVSFGAIEEISIFKICTIKSIIPMFIINLNPTIMVRNKNIFLKPKSSFANQLEFFNLQSSYLLF